MSTSRAQLISSPSEIVPVLRPSLRAKGLHFGRWRLVRSEHDSESEHSIKGEKGHARIVITELLEPGSAVPKYEFEMELALRETGRGRCVERLCDIVILISMSGGTSWTYLRIDPSTCQMAKRLAYPSSTRSHSTFPSTLATTCQSEAS